MKNTFSFYDFDTVDNDFELDISRMHTCNDFLTSCDGICCDWVCNMSELEELDNALLTDLKDSIKKYIDNDCAILAIKDVDYLKGKNDYVGFTIVKLHPDHKFRISSKYVYGKYGDKLDKSIFQRFIHWAYEKRCGTDELYVLGGYKRNSENKQSRLNIYNTKSNNVEYTKIVNNTPRATTSHM